MSGSGRIGCWRFSTKRPGETTSLYFDDLLGLYSAGVSSDSRLCMAEVLKPHVQQRRFRLLAELTPEALSALQQRDRGFADELEIVRVDETDEAATIAALLNVNRRFEQQHLCRFDLDVLPTVLEIPAAIFPLRRVPRQGGADAGPPGRSTS